MYAYKIKVYGIVQGVGFRPTIANLFNHFTGWVRNSSCCAEIYVESKKHLDIEDIIIKHKPPNAFIKSITCKTFKIKKFAYKKFSIKGSCEDLYKNINITPDLGICQSCTKELFDNTNRRFLHPLITCTNCGPRFSIAKEGLFDRVNTTMGAFEMCFQCKEEYAGYHSRRFHAQTISCFNCGPRYFYVQNKKTICRDLSAIKQTALDLTHGKVGLIKGIGGYHLICNAFDEVAIEKIKNIKRREEKPFAIIVKDINTARKYAYLSKKEIKILKSQVKPIVFVRSKNNKLQLVNLKSKYTGMMLPYAPIHLLLFHFSNLEAVTATSANISEFSLIYKDKDALNFEGIDFVLLHNRKIIRPMEDSIVQCINNNQLNYRYARGYAPSPFYLKSITPNILAFGGDLKNNIALTLQDTIVLSQYTSDLSNYDNYLRFEEKINDFLKFFNINHVELAVCDMHPNYYSSNFGKEKFPNILEVQHHKAHFGSVLLENGFSDDCIGVILDGTGFGEDGNIWGGEFFIKIDKSIKRIGHIKYMPMHFGETAIKEPYRIAASYLYDITKDIAYTMSLFPDYKDSIKILPKTNYILTSSAGRLFDAASAILNIAHKNQYEAQSAVLMQYEAMMHSTKKVLDFKIKDFIIDFSEAILYLAKNNHDKRYTKIFHNTFIRAVFENILSISRHTGIKNVALSGGVFQNGLVFGGLYKKLNKEGLKVIFNSRFPINDGGLAIGQIYFAKEKLCV